MSHDDGNGKVIPFPGKHIQSGSESGASFQEFVRFVQVGDLGAAAAQLRELLGICASSCSKAAQHFHDQFRAEPDFLAIAMSLRQAIQNNEQNQSLLLIGKVFGIYGPEAVLIYQALLKTVN